MSIDFCRKQVCGGIGRKDPGKDGIGEAHAAFGQCGVAFGTTEKSGITEGSESRGIAGSEAVTEGLGKGDFIDAAIGAEREQDGLIFDLAGQERWILPP